MKKLYKYIKITMLISALFTLSTCKKNKFLDVNKDPDHPTTVPVNLVLPTTEANIGYMIGNQLSIMGGLWAEYWTQDPANGQQYGAYDSYLNVTTDNDNVWQALYTTATNLNYIIQTADSSQKNYAAIAYFMKAYDFQVICDAWGAAPLSQALKGVSGNVSPTYDREDQIYDSLVVMVNNGLNLVDLTQSSPAEDLIYPGQSMTQWQKFARTLLLKIYMRQSLIRPSVAQAGIQSLPASTTSYLSDPVADDAELHYTNTIYQQFPLYATGLYLQVNNLLASNTCINYLNTIGDPRVADFYDSNDNGDYAGIPQGSFKTLAGIILSDGDYSPPSTTEIIAPDATVKFLTSSECNFLRAEAKVRFGLGAWPTALALYNNGIKASWNSWTNSAATIGAIAAYEASDSVKLPATPNAQIRAIITQKWVAMCGNQNFEAWTEWRRTGYPDFFVYSQASVIGNQYPRRLIYPSAEVNENSNFPGLQPITAPVWWDTHH